MTMMHQTHIGFNPKGNKSDLTVQLAPNSNSNRHLTRTYYCTLYFYLPQIFTVNYGADTTSNARETVLHTCSLKI